MPFVVSCDECNNQVRVSDKYAGKRIKCPHCQAVVLVPCEIEEAASTAARVSPNDWVDHRGHRIPKGRVFFVAPPPEIGPVQSAISTLPDGKEPWPADFKLKLAIVCTVIGTGLGVALDLGAGVQSLGWRITWVLVGTLLGLAVGTALENFHHWVTYVGERGIARLTHTGNPDKIHREVLCFDAAADLRGSRTRHLDIRDDPAKRQDRFTCRFEWFDDAGRSLMVVSTSDHRFGDKVPSEAHFFHFGNAAESAWTAYRLPEARQRLRAGESVTFRIFPVLLERRLKLTQASLTFCYGKKRDVWRTADIAEVECDRKKGVIRFRHIDAEPGWVSSKGIYEIAFGDLADVELFLVLLREFHGHPG